MNGTVIFGVALIIMALITQGLFFFPLLIGGVAVAAFGAFMPVKVPAGRKPPLSDDRFV